jgi:autotransporter-associated beta strand protein
MRLHRITTAAFAIAVLCSSAILWAQGGISRIPIARDLHGVDHTIGSLVWGGTVTNSGPNPATLTTGNDNTSTTFIGSIQDGTSPTALTKVGSGTQTLTGTNTYTGGTTVNGGIVNLTRGGGTGTLRNVTHLLGHRCSRRLKR